MTTPRLTLALLILCAAQAAPAQEDAGSSPLEALLAAPVSTAALYEQRLMDAAASITVITAEEIERYGYETLAEALNSVRGTFITYDRNYTYLGLRGFSRPADYNNRFLVMINGHRINETVFGSAGIGTELPLDMKDVERIELVRGPGSALYGSGALFGVINIIMKRGNTRETLRADVAVGTAGFRALSGGASSTIGPAAFRLSLLARSTEGDDLYFAEFDGAGSDGIAHHRDYDRSWGATGTLTHRELTVTAYAARRTKGIPTASFGTTFDDRSETTDDRRFLDITYAPRITEKLAVDARGSWNDYAYSGLYAGIEGDRESSDAEQATAELRILIDPFANHRIILGAAHVDHRVARYQVNDARADRSAAVSSLYTQYELQPSESLRLIGGLRYDAQHGLGSRTTPRAAIVYQPRAATSLKLLYGRAFRLPTLWERDFEDAETGYHANPDLKDETIRTVEAVWEEQLSPSLFATASVYEFRVRDLIDAVIDAGDGSSQFINQGEVRSRGIELELTRRAQRGLWSYVNYSFQRARGREELLANSPRHLLMAGLSGPVGSRFFAGIEGVSESPRQTLAGSSTPRQLVFNTRITAKLSSHWKLTAHVRNALDARYAHPASDGHVQDVIEQDGRTVSFQLGYVR